MSDPYEEVRARLLPQLEVEESVRLRPYQDIFGKWTIGIGRNLTDVGISMDEAIVLCDTDMTNAITELEHYPWYPNLDVVRQTALASMMFNLGASRFGNFHGMIKAFQEGNLDAAAGEAVNSAWYTQVGSRGKRIVAMLRTGQWPDDVTYAEDKA
jgi:lysozyme